MILFKACSRCGGDVDSTYPEDVYCVQCAHRPAALTATHHSAGSDAIPSRRHTCARCGLTDLVRLDKMRAPDNDCYRCRRCGHVFSPAVAPGHAAGGGA